MFYENLVNMKRKLKVLYHIMDYKFGHTINSKSQKYGKCLPTFT